MIQIGIFLIKKINYKKVFMNTLEWWYDLVFVNPDEYKSTNHEMVDIDISDKLTQHNSPKISSRMNYVFATVFAILLTWDKYEFERQKEEIIPYSLLNEWKGLSPSPYDDVIFHWINAHYWVQKWSRN